MNITSAMTNYYKHKPPLGPPAKQTQFKPKTNPIKPKEVIMKGSSNHE